MREAPDDLAADILYEGILNFPSGVVSLATVGAADEDIFELPAPGRWNIKVFTEGSPRPDYIRVIFRSAD